MDFLIERTASEADDYPVYTLLDAQGASLLRAERGQGALPEERRQMRLTRPGGRLVATIDLSQVESPAMAEEKRTDYAIIHEFAVYAIVSVCRRPDADDNGASGVYFVLEVEGETWLALPHPEEAGCFALYDEVPAGLHTYDTLTELDLPASIGRICQQNEGSRLTIRLAPRRLKRTDMVLLALGYLIDQSATSP